MERGAARLPGAGQGEAGSLRAVYQERLAGVTLGEKKIRNTWKGVRFTNLGVGSAGRVWGGARIHDDFTGGMVG